VITKEIVIIIFVCLCGLGAIAGKITQRIRTKRKKVS